MNKQVEQIKAEIKRRIKEYKAKYPKDTGGYWLDEEVEALHCTEEYERFLMFIDNLEEEPQVKASPYQKDIASYITDFNYCFQEGDKITTNEDGTRFNVSQLKRVAVSEDLEEAAEEYNKSMSWRWEAPNYPHKDAFIAGANWQKKKTNDELLKIYNELRDRQVTDFDINIKEE